MPRSSSKDKYIVQAFELFKRKGLSLNMEQIAQGLGLTKKTLYNNFGSKQELISAAKDHFFMELEQRIAARFKDSANAIEALIGISSVIHAEIGRLGALLLEDVSNYRSNSGIFNFTNRTGFYSAVIRDNLQRGIREGLYRKDVDVDYATLFYTAAIDRFYHWDGSFRYLDDSLTPHYHDELVKHHLYAVVNDAGRKILENYLSQIK